MEHSRTPRMTRRDFIAAGAACAAGAALTPSAFGSMRSARAAAEITVGITVDTRPDWNGPENFIRSIDEASEIGYRWIETFWNYVSRWESNPQGLEDELERRNLRLETVSNSGPMRTNFTDPAQRAGVIEDHKKLIRFIHRFGCDHLKINVGGAQPLADSHTPAVYREMAATFNELGRWMTDLGMKFGVHAHLNSAFETRQDIDAIMELTDPRHVHFVLDTGHVTMAGMDPVQLTRDYASRIIEYHLKDVAPADLGGHRGPPMGRRAVAAPPQGGPAQPPQGKLPASVRFRDRYFFELGRGGVDFPAILRVLGDAGWKGWFTVELDSTITTAKGSATVNKEYVEQVLGLQV